MHEWRFGPSKGLWARLIFVLSASCVAPPPALDQRDRAPAASLLPIAESGEGSGPGPMGCFVDAGLYRTGWDAVIAIGDFNADGVADLAAVNRLTPFQLTVFLGG